VRCGEVCWPDAGYSGAAQADRAERILPQCEADDAASPSQPRRPPADPDVGRVRRRWGRGGAEGKGGEQQNGPAVVLGLNDDRIHAGAPLTRFRRANMISQQVLGGRASSFTSYPVIRDWVDGVSLKPGRIPPELAGSAAVTAAQERLAQDVVPGMARLAQLAGMA
jgi:hypothetical protein